MARGGYRPNSGRKPIEKRLSNYEKAIKMLDNHVEEAIQVLIDGFQDEDKNYRIRCAEIFLKKAIADKKDISGSFDISDNPLFEILKNNVNTDL